MPVSARRLRPTWAACLLIIGVLLAASGIAYGSVSVRNGGMSCGTGFSRSDATGGWTMFSPLSSGADPGASCYATQSNRQATTWALLAPGIVALFGAVVLQGKTSIDRRAEKKKRPPSSPDDPA